MASGTDCSAHLPSDSQLLGLSILILSCIFYELLFHDFGRYKMLLSNFSLYSYSLIFSYLFFPCTYFLLVLLIMTWHHHGVQHHRLIWFLYVVFYLDCLFFFSPREAWAICPYFLSSVSTFCFCVVRCSMDMALYFVYLLLFYLPSWPVSAYIFSHLAAFAFA